MKTEIRLGGLCAAITQDGAELLSVVYNGKERSYQGSLWPKHAPVLFPFAGPCTMRIDDKVYQTARHGFARENVFDIAKQSEESITLTLREDEKSLTRYPYPFLFEITYQIEDPNKLIIKDRIVNTGKEAMPFSYGGHDSFSLEDDVENYELVTEKKERFEALLQDEPGYLTGEKLFVTEGDVIDLDSPVLKNGLSMVLGGIESRKVVLRHKKTKKNIVSMEWKDEENLVLWHPGKERMICIEPWLNLPDPVGDEADFREKKGIVLLKPGEEKTIQKTITYFD